MTERRRVGVAGIEGGNDVKTEDAASRRNGREDMPMGDQRVNEILNNKYQVINLLGEGTTSGVYLVSDMNSERLYAMKVCRDTALLKQESELLKKLKHRLFPEWIDYFEEDCGYLVMEYVDGITLQKLLEAKKLELSQSMFIMEEILTGLEYLHGQTPAVIYRDLKPANIMISKSGALKLVDFGGAMETVAKYKVGTYGYAAPEQFWDGVRLGPECDLYAAGKILAYLLCGKDPCEPPYDVLTYCDRSREVTPEFFRVLQRSLANEIEGRYASAGEFLRDLKAAEKKKRSRKWMFFPEKHKILYEKCIWKSEYQRIF